MQEYLVQRSSRWCTHWRVILEVLYITVGVGIQKITNTRGEMVMTRVTRVAHITVGVGDLKITNNRGEMEN